MLSDPTSPAPSIMSVEWALANNKFVYLPGQVMEALVAKSGSLSDWDKFSDSWSRLGRDNYMADSGRYRRRRHAVFNANNLGPILLAAHQPHYQSRNHNTLNGGIERWFEQVEPEIAVGVTCSGLLMFCRDVFSRIYPNDRSWFIEMHQFRIEAKPGSDGKPTPEGMHRDGVDFALVMMIQRSNIQKGETIMTATDGTQLGRFTLAERFDTVLIDDRDVFHGVTPVEALDPQEPSFRDVLVLTYRRT